ARGGEVVHIDVSAVLVDDAPRAAAGPADVVLLVVGQLRDLPRRRIDGEEVGGPVAVGGEDDPVADPGRLGRAAVVLRQLVEPVGGQVVDPEVRGHPYAIA